MITDEQGTGTVATFDAEGGVGHVETDDGRQVWVHYSNIEMSGYRTLEVGQRVDLTYEPVVNQDGFVWRALWVGLRDGDGRRVSALVDSDALGQLAAVEVRDGLGRSGTDRPLP